MKKYLKFSCCNVMCLITTLSFLKGGPALFIAFASITLLAVFGDLLLGDDSSSPQYKHTWLLNSFLYINLPLLILAMAAYLWQFGDGDPHGFGQWMDQTWGTALMAGKAATQTSHLVGGFLGLGLLFGIAATNVSHELVHRTWSRSAQETGRWLLAFTWDAAFAIEHVYGHHRRVATWDDPASSRRGESFYPFFLRSLWMGNKSAWEIESSFLKKKRLPLWSHHNRLLRGWAISLLMVLASYAMIGWQGVALQVALALYGKAYLELVNYIEHYGLVRLPQTPVHLRHSWNSNSSISSWFLFNLTRHSHHHATGHIPFWKLEPQTSAPRLPYGYMTMLLIALIPPFFKALMKGPLDRWDASQATADEKAFIAGRGGLSAT